MSIYTRLVGATPEGLLPPVVRRKILPQVNVADYVVGDGVADDTAGVRQAIGVAMSERRTLYFPDQLTIGVTDTITMGDTRPNSIQATILSVEGLARFKAKAAIDGPVVRLRGTQQWAGALDVDAANLAPEAVTMDTIGRTRGLDIHARYATVWGLRVLAVGNNNAVSLGYVRTVQNGSKVDRTATATSTTGGGSTQSTTGVFGDTTEAGWTQFTLSSAVPAQFLRPGAVKFVYDATSECWWRVRNFADATTINLYNYRPAAGTTAALTIPCGGGVSADKWGDSGCWQITTLDSRDNPGGIGLHWAGSYGMNIGTLALQNNAVGIACEQYMIGFSADYAYFELTGPPLVLNDGANSRIRIGPGPKTEIDKVQIIRNNTAGAANRNLLPEAVEWSTTRGSQVMTTSAPSASNLGTTDVRPGKTYFFKRTSGAQALRLDCTQWREEGALGIHFLTVFFELASASDKINVSSISQGSGATHTINGGSSATIAVPAAKGRLDLIRTGTDWRWIVTGGA